jgi:hypothetical protein
MRRALAGIVVDAQRAGPGVEISYSRRREWWARMGRYLHPDYSYDTVVPSIDLLVEAGILTDHVKGISGYASGWQSTYKPGPQLAGLQLPSVRYRVGELIRLKDANGNLKDYRDTDRIVRERRFLTSINDAVGSLEISLDLPGAIRDGSAIRIPPGKPGEGDHVVYMQMRSLYRVYNRTFSLGGRMYGGWWQQVRSRDRQFLAIDGASIVEEDYPSLHPRLLYARIGLPLVGDAYAVPGWEQNRKACKIGFNVLLNAESFAAAQGAIAGHFEEEEARALGVDPATRSRRPKGALPPHHMKRAADLIRAIKARHPRVAHLFHSGEGLKLQHVDAGMCREVLKEMTLKRGLPCLPIHDSFLVRQPDRDALLTAMEQAAAKHGMYDVFAGETRSKPAAYGISIPQEEEKWAGLEAGGCSTDGTAPSPPPPPTRTESGSDSGPSLADGPSGESLQADVSGCPPTPDDAVEQDSTDEAPEQRNASESVKAPARIPTLRRIRSGRTVWSAQTVPHVCDDGPGVVRRAGTAHREAQDDQVGDRIASMDSSNDAPVRSSATMEPMQAPHPVMQDGGNGPAGSSVTSGNRSASEIFRWRPPVPVKNYRPPPAFLLRAEAQAAQAQRERAARRTGR